MRDPLRENLLARHVQLILMAGALLACGTGALAHRRATLRHAQSS
ncbi:hypothetical protein AB0L63_19755 [Nocardia sp. NPDC051990]